MYLNPHRWPICGVMPAALWPPGQQSGTSRPTTNPFATKSIADRRGEPLSAPFFSRRGSIGLHQFNDNPVRVTATLIPVCV